MQIIPSGFERTNEQARRFNMALQIVRDVCTACGDCEPVCPTKSITPFKGVYKIDVDTCTECDGDFDLPQCLDVCMEDDCIIAA
jgi:ferredoxin